MSFTQPSLKGRALRLLSGREYSRAELERKLKTHEETPGELVRALDELQVKGFISEQRVVESVINRRSAKLGTARIRQELQGKGLDPQAVTDAVASLKATELVRAREVWRKKFGAKSDDAPDGVVTDAAERGKQMRFLAARGFGGDVIRRVVSGGAGDDALDG
ncbi:MAG: recombination regulator RecX [Rhodoferax sp.]|nr:recombination regulator RecX [Rhodoferax sp.]